jgi:hypothetical protein
MTRPLRLRLRIAVYLIKASIKAVLIIMTMVDEYRLKQRYPH